ncbi:MAG: serine/threonine-protein phosphatase [Sphingobacteriaceae bacterium]|nr:serine/threonine-protein phosphatase [Sphingobacteriaceae bacterium]
MAENFFGLTDTGKVRDNNEDAFIAKKVMDNKFIIACAIDGVGGYSGGEIAAEIARESIFENFARPSGDLIAAMKSSFILANQKIFNEKLQNKEHGKMACVLTLAVVDVENNQFHYAHVGDTRLYLLRDSSLVKVSKDHSFVGFLEDSGRIDEDAAMKHLKRNEINKALGFGTDIETQDDYIETGSSPFLPGDLLLLCSDGLTDMVNKDDITSILISNNSLEEKAKQLVALANKNGGKDNITVVLVQNDTASSWQATPPAGIVSGSAVKKKVATNYPAPVAENKTAIIPAPVTPLTKSNGINKILGGLCLLFLASTLFLLWRNAPGTEEENTVVAPVADTRNAEEKKLQGLLDAVANDTLLLSDSIFKQPIVISDTLNIHQDSLFILSKGKIILRGDSAFHGPAFMLSTDSRLVLLDGLQFENFDVAVSAQNDALFLRNVQFLNCKWPIQNFFVFPDKQFITGRLAGSYVFRTDSLITTAPTR